MTQQMCTNRRRRRKFEISVPATCFPRTATQASALIRQNDSLCDDSSVDFRSSYPTPNAPSLPTLSSFNFIATMPPRRGSRKRRRAGYQTLRNGRLRLSRRAPLSSQSNDFLSEPPASEDVDDVGTIPPALDPVTIQDIEDGGGMNDNAAAVASEDVGDSDEIGDFNEGNEFNDVVDITRWQQDEDVAWNDALGAAMLEDMTTQQRGTSTESASSAGTDVDCKLSETDVRKLLRGKTLEALSFIIGNKGATAREYGHFAMVINSYTRRLRESRYPCYTTLLYKHLSIIRSACFIRKVEVCANIDTNRSGVMQRYVTEDRRGEAPTVQLSVIPPSEWGRRDLMIYDYLHSEILPRDDVPCIVRFEYSPLVSPRKRRSLANTLHEEYIGMGGYRTGLRIEQGDEVTITISDSAARAVFDCGKILALRPNEYTGLPPPSNAVSRLMVVYGRRDVRPIERPRVTAGPERAFRMDTHDFCLT